MATTQNIPEADRLAAQLALAATGRRPEPPCLTDKELADLASGRLQPPQRERALAHLADCEGCYEAWRAVQSVSHLEKKQLRLLQPRYLKWWGSALAIAASVVIFVQLQEMPLQRQSLPTSSPSAAQEKMQDAKQQAVPAEKIPAGESGSSPNLQLDQAPQEEPGRRKTSAPAPAPPPAHVLKKKERASAANKLSELRLEPSQKADKEQTADAIQPAPAPPAASVEAAREMSMAARPVGSGAAAPSWSDRVKMACERGENSPAVWIDLYREGLQIAKGRRSFGQLTNEQGMEVLRLTGRISKQEDIAEQCGLIQKVFINSEKN